MEFGMTFKELKPGMILYDSVQEKIMFIINIKNENTTVEKSYINVLVLLPITTTLITEFIDIITWHDRYSKSCKVATSKQLRKEIMKIYGATSD